MTNPSRRAPPSRFHVAETTAWPWTARWSTASTPKHRYRDYHWIACLDPVELADGDPDRGLLGTSIDDVHCIDHGGRPSWSATVIAGPAYEPRCACCPLLPSAVADRLEGIPPTDYADAHLVVLDRATGICVSTTELGGPRNGLGHEILINEVDEAVDDDFVTAGGLR